MTMLVYHQLIQFSYSGEGLMNMNTVGIAFLPLDAISVEAAKFQKELKEKILADIKEDKYSDGLRKQYELQLQHLEDKVPSLEIMLGPGTTPYPRQFLFLVNRLVIQLTVFLCLFSQLLPIFGRNI